MRITEDTAVKRNSSLRPVDINGQLSMLNAVTGKYVVLNSVGASIWSLSSETILVRDLIVNLVNEFDVSYDTCKKQVLPYLDKLKKERMIDIV